VADYCRTVSSSIAGESLSALSSGGLIAMIGVVVRLGPREAQMMCEFAAQGSLE
jgi:hypothetical protein